MVRLEKKKSAAKRTVRKKLAAEPKPRPTLKDLLALRRKISNQRPRFVRQESWRYDRVAESWRRPRGVDSHIRLGMKGWPKVVRVGYRGPAAVRSLHPSGLRDVLVHNVNQIQRLNPETDAARIGSTVGSRKRAELYLRAKELGIKILNLRKTPTKER